MKYDPRAADHARRFLQVWWASSGPSDLINDLLSGGKEAASDRLSLVMARWYEDYRSYLTDDSYEDGTGMSLQEYIYFLEALPQNHIPPAVLARGKSYRGYYERLAFERFVNDSRLVDVAQMADHARSLLGTTMTGYKGGEYCIRDHTLLHVAPWGETGPALTESLLVQLLGLREEE